MPNFLPARDFTLFNLVIRYLYYIHSAGGKANAVQNCHVCRGTGTKISLVQIGPGMVQQTQRMCPECQGEGICQQFLSQFFLLYCQ